MTLDQVPQNGFTKTMRRVMAISCWLAFFGLILADATGWIERSVPLPIYAMLFAGGSMMFDAVNEIIKRFGGKK
ncbi:MAG: hypothetical protein KDJ69_12030 [Nitratireductor sp.]|nr:hypothetical protein [Nitratireductor sp.]